MGSYGIIEEDGNAIFGPNLNSEHCLYEAFTVTLVVALNTYLTEAQITDDNFDEYIRICEENVIQRIQS